MDTVSEIEDHWSAAAVVIEAIVERLEGPESESVRLALDTISSSDLVQVEYMLIFMALQNLHRLGLPLTRESIVEELSRVEPIGKGGFAWGVFENIWEQRGSYSVPDGEFSDAIHLLQSARIARDSVSPPEPEPRIRRWEGPQGEALIKSYRESFERSSNMAQQTMNTIDAFRQAYEDEFQKTRRVLQAYPAEKASMKPTEKSRSAQELAWMMTLNQMVPVPVLDMSELTGSGLPKAPATWRDVMAAFEQAHKDTTTRLSKVTDLEWNSELRLPVAPKQMGSMKRGDALWMFLHDSIHHRGQFSVYLRLAGAKVPSIYGPSADESWA